MAWWIVSGCVVILLTDRIRDLWRQVSDPLGNRVDIALLRQQEFKKTDRLVLLDLFVLEILLHLDPP